MLPAGLPHRLQTGLDVGKIIAARRPRPYSIMELGVMAVDGYLQEEQWRFDQPFRAFSHARPIRGNGTGQAEVCGRVDEIQGPLVEHRFPTPKIDQGAVAMFHQISEDFLIPGNRDFILFQYFQILVMQETPISPLSAGMAPQIAAVRDPKAGLSDLVRQAVAAVGIPDIEKKLFGFQGRQLGTYPGMFGQA
jgi:hypothetical protein